MFRPKMGDIDNDGDQDFLYVSPILGGPIYELRNDGLAGFTQLVTGLPALTGGRSAFLIDFDGDGDLDVLISEVWLSNHTPWLFRRESNGTYSNVSSMLPSYMPAVEAVVACDIDNDGDQDLVAAGLINGFSQVLVNNSNSFASISLPGLSLSIEVGDIDGDGDLDILARGLFSGPYLWRNDGGLVFTDISLQLPVAGTMSMGAGFGDVDGDGDEDIYFSSLTQDSVLLNNGAGVFSHLVGGAVATVGNGYVKLVDVDGDDDLDLLRMSSAGSLEMARNNGAGFFSLGASAFGTSSCGGPILVADFDGDLDVDLACGAGMMLNQHRHLQASSPPTIGQTWLVDVVSQPGYSVAPRLSQLGVSLQQLTAPVRLPQVGSLWLDPAHFITIQSSWLLVNQSTTTFAFPIPNIPLLAGIGLHVQALVADGGAGPGVHLTHMLSQVIQ